MDRDKLNRLSKKDLINMLIKSKTNDERERIRNPNTNRMILVNGATYKKVFRSANKVLNPLTGRYILRTSRTFQKVFPDIHKKVIALNKKFRAVNRKLAKRAKEVDDHSRSIESKYDEITKLIEIKRVRKALNSSVKSFKVDIINMEDPLIQLNDTRDAIKQLLVKEINLSKGFKYNETLEITLKKKNGNILTDVVIEKITFFNSKTETLINEMEINKVLQSSREEIMRAIGRWISEGSGWTIKSVNNHYINLTKYKPFKGSSYLELPTELRNSAKGLINLQNKDKCCFAWCHVRHLNPQIKDPQRIKKCDNVFIKDKIVNYDGIEFPVAVKDYNKIEKMNSICINVFAYEEKRIFPLYISKDRLKTIWNCC